MNFIKKLFVSIKMLFSKKKVKEEALEKIDKIIEKMESIDHDLVVLEANNKSIEIIDEVIEKMKSKSSEKNESLIKDHLDVMASIDKEVMEKIKSDAKNVNTKKRSKGNKKEAPKPQIQSKPSNKSRGKKLS